MDEEIPLKLVELSEFLRHPSILSKRLQYKQTKNGDLLTRQEQGSNGFQFKDTKPGIVLLTRKAISTDEHNNVGQSKQKELIVPKDVIIFADDVDRKKLGLLNKSNNHFSRHLLITSGAALQALIPSLTNAKEWIILCKLKYTKRYTKQPTIHGNVILSLNVNHPLVRYELLTALDLLQQSFHEIKTAYIMVDFSQILTRWFKNYLRRTDQYPTLSNRILYRYQIQTWKCSITLGKREGYHNNEAYNFGATLSKYLRKSDVPMEIAINFNSLPTMVYSIHLNNIFIYSMNEEYKESLRNMGNGLSLVSVQNFNPCENTGKESSIPASLLLPSVQKQEIPEEKASIQVQDESDYPVSKSLSREPSEEEKYLFEKLWDNRIRIEMQHQQLMMKAARLLCFPPANNDSFNHKDTTY